MKKKNNKERRCLSCGKLLLDEKMPLCARCYIEGKDKTLKAGEFALGVAAIGYVGANKIRK